MLAAYACVLGSYAWNRLATPAIVDSDESIHSIFAWQVHQGMPLYGPRDDPRVQDLFSYTPFSFQVMGNLAKLFSVDVRLFRATTLFAGLLAALVLWGIGRRLGASRWVAAIAAIFFLAFPQPLWFVTIGPNAFLVLFTLLSLWLLLRDPKLSVWTVILAAVSAFLAFWSKQTGLIAIAALIFSLAVRNWRRALLAIGALAAIATPLFIHYASQPGSSFLYNVFVLQKQSPMNWGAFPFPSLFPELLGRFGLLIAAGIWCALSQRSLLDWIRKPEWVFLGGAVVVAVIARLKYGSGPVQGLLMGALLPAVVLSAAWQACAASVMARRFFYVVCLVQGLCLIQSLAPYRVTPEDESRYRQLLDLVAMPGKEVYYNNASFYQVLAHKPVYTTMGRDCYWHGEFDPSRYPEKLRAFLESDPFDVIIVDIPLEDNSWPLYQRVQSGNYERIGDIPATARNADVMTLRNQKLILARKGALGAPVGAPQNIRMPPNILPVE